MSKLSEPVAKALRKLLNACNGDTKVVSRVITGNYGPEEYFFNLKEEINLLRSKSAPYDSIVLALAQFIIAQSAPKATEQPSAAAAVEGILTEEELNKITNNIGNLELWDPRTTIERLITSHRSLLSANAELSFKNKMLKESLSNISTHVGDVTSTDFFYDAYSEVKQLAFITLGDLK